MPQWHTLSILCHSGILAAYYATMAYWQHNMPQWHTGSIICHSGILAAYYATVAYCQHTMPQWHTGSILCHSGILAAYTMPQWHTVSIYYATVAYWQHTMPQWHTGILCHEPKPIMRSSHQLRQEWLEPITALTETVSCCQLLPKSIYCQLITTKVNLLPIY